ncbi:Zinc finger, PMZ-type [Sesbania bispinosa]|nr:Zinc finger, PMZ-type [Sesbania bispinosa]
MDEGDGQISDTETMMYSEDFTQCTNDDSVSNGERGEEGEDGVPLIEGGDDEDSEESGDENESGDKYRIDGVAFEFYNKYAQKRGFATRKWNTVVNKEGRVSQQTFVCFREGYRLKKHLKNENRKREARAITRCGCFAFLKVRYARDISRWIVKAFSDEHSHELLPRKYEGMLTSHRKMNETDIMQMNAMREVGIGVTQIYGLVANQSGGYKNVGYRKSDMYNEIFKQRRSEGSDARGDYEVGRFRTKWEELICEFGLQSNQWVSELYNKKKMWATAHIRGSFFAGFRTTSRCEGLHSQVGRYVHYRNNLREFLRHFFQYLAYTRQKELEADFESINGDPVLQTPFDDIEASAAKLYSRKVFMKFRVVLWRACKLKVSGCERTPNCHIYIVTNRSRCGREWHMSYVAQNEEVKCSCQRMESMGIPCEHIVVLLHYLDIKQLPNSLILERWTKYAKQSVDGADLGTSSFGGSMWKSQVISLLFDCYEMCRLAGKRMDKLEETRGVIRNHLQSLKVNEEDGNNDEGNDQEGDDINLRDPSHVRSKGCGSRQSTGGSRGNRRTTTCSVCQGRGHNKQTCQLRRRHAHPETNETAGSGDDMNE